ncbi:MAG: cytochrome c [Pseudomonadota bacterium]|nr:cytochrome c [Pseudomonadota bacterium]
MSKNRENDARSVRRSGLEIVALLALGVGIFAGPAAADEPAGAAIFAGRCAVCHGPEAAGIPGSFPALHEQVVAFGKTPEGRDYLVMVVSTGLMGDLKLAGVSYRGVMPAQSGLSEAEVAAVLTYLASDRGKDSTGPALTATDVAAARARHPGGTSQSTRALRPAFPET